MLGLAKQYHWPLWSPDCSTSALTWRWKHVPLNKALEDKAKSWVALEMKQLIIKRTSTTHVLLFSWAPDSPSYDEGNKACYSWFEVGEKKVQLASRAWMSAVWVAVMVHCLKCFRERTQCTNCHLWDGVWTPWPNGKHIFHLVQWQFKYWSLFSALQ